MLDTVEKLESIQSSMIRFDSIINSIFNYETGLKNIRFYHNDLKVSNNRESNKMFIILENFPCIVMQLQNNHWALWSKEKNLLEIRKLWNLLEIKLKYTEKKKEHIHMFDLVECAYYLDNTEALEYFLSFHIIKSASSSSFSLNNSNNYTTEALAFSLKNSYRNNNKTTTPEPTTYILKNSYCNNNLNSISEYSNLNNNSTSLARSASCSRQL
ncbi:hypothetical protein DICPUDRAFT_85024 [Dictyostelium purpureum]|uniref:Uncharacterized protein n=1 Tax=Dictyostelium purpureum TaxID=5786 RepID=F1A4G1_DICPU|nr:uncharacterized protein DICPUDRAFT_85024 [Dictyostelium purpureum]EGC28921.1 hypothetical protein DICPUDRAFT_85024 [Dictyostelium purpureum]|eukprot:XP_003294555.1 hypothetical protein DICPUDRAFT_85024 [Dictyostelium purpureum]